MSENVRCTVKTNGRYTVRPTEDGYSYKTVRVIEVDPYGPWNPIPRQGSEIPIDQLFNMTANDWEVLILPYEEKIQQSEDGQGNSEG